MGRKRCEGWTVPGGVFGFDARQLRPELCENDALVVLEIQIGETTTTDYWACVDCWRKARVTDGLTVVYAVPVPEAVEVVNAQDPGAEWEFAMPAFYTTDPPGEGGAWTPWGDEEAVRRVDLDVCHQNGYKYSKGGSTVYALLFDNGLVWDMKVGFRRDCYTRADVEELKERVGVDP